MSFVQIITFTTDHADRLPALEADWRAATEGRRTLLAEQVYVDHHDPRRHVILNVFEDYESAMVNSALPETTAMAEQVGALLDASPDYLDLDLLAEADVRHDLAAAVRRSLEGSTATPDTFTDDVRFDAFFPHQVVGLTGRAAMAQLLLEEAPSRTIEKWECVTTENGFAVEFRYRTHGAVSYLSVGTVLATIRDGRVSRMLVTCAGSWDAAAEAQALGLAGASA